ncbi:MAG: 6-phospho-beta-glucosidase [Arachnia sp.]
MKLTILGGGGFRVPLIHDAVVTNAIAASGRPSIDITEIALQDSSPERLHTMEKILAERTAELPEPGTAPRITATTDVRQAVADADFIFSAIRVGGSAGRALDERVALELGLLGQETIGPGGLAYALRTIPVMHEVARIIAEVAPNAWTINFTNPAGIVTQAMRQVLGDRVVGICDTPIGLVRRVSRLLGVSLENDQNRVDYDYIGLNHMGWLRSVRIDGMEKLPGVLADDDALDSIEEARLIGKDWVRTIGALPNEYLYYYWHTDEAISKILGSGRTRGEFLMGEQDQFEKDLACCSSPLTVWREALHERESTYMAEAREDGDERRQEDIAGGGYQEVALRLMTALATGSSERMILDVGNGSAQGLAVPELPADVVIEVGCVVDGDGIRPMPVAPLSLGQLGMMARLRASESAICEAALTGSTQKAWEGFALHPLVDSPRLGKALLEGYRRAHPSIDALLTHP